MSLRAGKMDLKKERLPNPKISPHVAVVISSLSSHRKRYLSSKTKTTGLAAYQKPLKRYNSHILPCG